VHIEFDNIGWEDLECDHSSTLLTEFCERCRLLPPVSDHTKKPYQSSALVKTLENVVRLLQKKFGHKNEGRDIFSREDISEWRRMLSTDHHRNMMEGIDESDFLKNSFPIYRINSERNAIIFTDDFSDQLSRESKEVSMQNICMRMFQREEFTPCLKLLFTYFGVGRGGESKFLNYTRWYYCNRFNMLFMQWFQRKTLKSNPSAFAPDYEIPEMSIWLMLGCFWACRDGLSRPNGIGEPHSALRRKSSYVFQDLHAMRDDSVAGQLTGSIRSKIPVQLRKFYSVKSLRYGACTHMNWDVNVTTDETIALGGWSSHSNRDFYVWTYLVSVIPPALSLAGYPDPRVIPSMPDSSECFRQGEPDQKMTIQQFNNFVIHLYVINLPEFQPPAGRMRDLLMSVTAAMIMHFDYIYHKYGGHHLYVKKMVNSALKANIGVNPQMCIQKLQFWSKVILNDYKKRNNEPGRNNYIQGQPTKDAIIGIKDRMSSVVTGLLDIKSEVQTLSIEIDNLRKENRELRTLIQSTVNNLAYVSTSQARIEHWLQKILREGGHHFGSPTSTLLQRGQPLNYEQDVTEDSTTSRRIIQTPNESVDQFEGSIAAASEATNTGASYTGASKTGASSVTPNQLTARTLTYAVPNATKKTKGVRNPQHSVNSVLRTMYDQHKNLGFASLELCLTSRLQDQTTWVWTNVFAASSTKDQSKINRALKLIDCIWTTEERSKLIKHTETMLDAIKICNDIEKRVVQAAHVLQKNPPQKATPSRKATGGLLGIANSIAHLTWSHINLSGTTMETNALLHQESHYKI
ncbi:MAG: hypothetical protein ACRCZI_10930, partial [Cetobacterium sp.]